jgi:hypothetical protein
LSQNVPIKGHEKVRFARLGGEIECRVQGVEFEEIAVGFAGRRARASVAHPPEVCHSLPGPVRKRFGLGNAFGELVHFRGEVVNHPVHPVTDGSVRIVRD